MNNFRLAFFTHSLGLSRIPRIARLWQRKFPNTRICVLAFGAMKSNGLDENLGLCSHTIHIPDAHDFYFRERQLIRGDSPYGQKAGPNWSFFEGLRLMGQSHNQTWTYLLEDDVLPVGGEDRLDEIIRNADSKAWVIGSRPPGVVRSGLHPTIRNHLNGVALYKTSSLGFQDFLQTAWRDSLLEKATVNPEVAFDILSAPKFWKGLAPPLREIWSQNSSRFVRSKITLNLSILSLSQVDKTLLEDLLQKWRPVGLHVKF